MKNSTGYVYELRYNDKLDYLEGMRALMAINVILCHFVCVYYPQMYFMNYKGNNGFLSLFAVSPLNVFVNGSVAVDFFFVLTGFLVGRTVLRQDISMRLVGKKCLSRYIRLLPVVFTATLFTFITMKLDLQQHLNINNAEVNIAFLQGYCNFEETLFSLISNIFILPFINHSSYVGPFWTIKYEFWGYIFCLIVGYILRNKRWRRIAYIAVALLFICVIDIQYAFFMMGLFVSDVVYRSEEGILHNIINNRWCLLIGFIISIYLSCIPLNYCTLYS